jgi:3-hydroxybutyrate dehydrogenase
MDTHISGHHRAGIGRDLAGRVALVTGSTSGIGLGIARALAVQGAALMLNGLGVPDTVAEIQQDLANETGAQVLYSGADLSDLNSIERMIDMTCDMLGGVDILVNNAGIQHVAPVHQFPRQKWDQIIALNLSAAFHTIRLVLPGMKRVGWGRIINIASAHGLVASPFKSAYVAAKHGLVGLTKTVALETAELPITCNAVCPGYVATPLIDAQIEAQARAHGLPREQVIRDVLLAQQPNKRFANVDEIGAMTAFLASEAAASITGAAIAIDGGWTAH